MDNISTPFLHVSFYPEMKPIEEMDFKTKDGWLFAVRCYDKILNNYYDKSGKELDWISQVEKLLKENTPEEYRKGVHILFEQASFMGEDICIQDGNITTTMHWGHKECGTYKISFYKEMYCITCQKKITRDETIP